jgi:hypothetical protein
VTETQNAGTVIGSSLLKAANTYTDQKSSELDGTLRGAISSSGYTLPKATTAVLGGVKVDGSTITAD